MPRNFEFMTQLRMSSEATASSDVSGILLKEVPGAVSVEQATTSDDRQGTDYWVTLQNGKRLSVDAKIRTEDRFGDDLALETWSVVEQQVVGWSRDHMKQTDYVLWLWKDTGRWRLVPFIMLCSSFARRWMHWSQKYKVANQRTTRPNGSCYHSQCVFVPTRVLWAAIYRDSTPDALRRAAA